MNCQRICLSSLAGLALGLVLAHLPASATTILPQTPAQLVDGAELIFVGTAVHEEFAQTHDGTYAYTFVTFEVEEALKGAAEDAHLTLRFDGGPVGVEDHLEVAGMPAFTVGERYLLFVAGNGHHGCPVLGWNQGKLEFRPHPLTGEEVLVERTGALVEGLDAAAWRRSPVRMAADGTIHEKQRLLAEVVASEGVEIVAGPVVGLAPEPRALIDARQDAVGAEDVLGELRALVRERSLTKRFAAGRVVSSARVEDVPPQKVFHAVVPEAQ